MNPLSKDKSKIDRTVYRILMLVVIVASVVGIYQYREIKALQNDLQSNYQRAFFELTNYVDNVDNHLSKALIVNTKYQRNMLANSLWKEASFAQSCLGQLPISNTALDNTERFLSQVGDYCYSLNKDISNNEPLSEEDINHLNELSTFASDLNTKLQEMQASIQSGTMKMKDITGEAKQVFGEKQQDKPTNLTSIEKHFEDYPSLMYDGPFSDHVTKMQPEYIKDGPEITKEKAQEIVQNIISKANVGEISKIDFIDECSGTIPSYDFNIKIKDHPERQITIEITKKLGKLLLITDNYSSGETKISDEEAIAKAEKFLESIEMQNMTRNYYQKSGNRITIDFCYMQDNIAVYPDLVKVEVSLDNGAIIGYESHGYIMCHKQKRDLPKVNISDRSAREKINKSVEFLNSKLAIIPLESGKEALCHEVHCKFRDREYIIYVNVTNGHEEKVFKLLVSPNGTLSI